MSLADALEQILKESESRCRTCAWYLAMPYEDQKAFDEWVAQGHSQSQLKKACERMGLEISRTSFREHLYSHHLTISSHVPS